jgi:hypothetical protein
MPAGRMALSVHCAQVVDRALPAHVGPADASRYVASGNSVGGWASWQLPPTGSERGCGKTRLGLRAAGLLWPKPLPPT